MRKIVVTLIVGCASLTALAAAPRATQSDAKAPPPLGITLGEKTENIQPGKIADGWAEGGKIDVQAKDNTLTVLMTGTAAAHCRVGCQSVGVQTFQLTQEFEVTSKDPKVTEVALSLDSALNGILWARHKAGACMRVASATVGPAGGSAPLGLQHPPMCLSSAGCYQYQSKAGPFESAPMSVGRYVLTACFTFDAGASGFVNGHGLADFSAEDPLPDGWKMECNYPFKDVERKDFGFAINVSAAPVPGSSGQTTALLVKPGVQKVKYSPKVSSSADLPALTPTSPAPSLSR